MFTENSGFIKYNWVRKKRPIQFTLKLTSMIDMFTILLIFLLKSFSAEGQIMTVAPDLQLPESTAQKPPQSVSVIAVTNEWILLDGKQIVPVSEVILSKQLLIPRLAKELKNLRVISEKVGEISADMGFTGKISIQGDKQIPYQLLKSVMYTCGQIGYNDMLLAVMKLE